MLGVIIVTKILENLYVSLNVDYFGSKLYTGMAYILYGNKM